MSRRTILVVDDDDNITALLAEILDCAGYRVLTANTASAGLDCALNEQVDATVADVVLPDWTGIEMVQQLKALRPAAKVLFISGYMGDLKSVSGLRDDPDVRFLSKPVRPPQLLDAVSGMLS